MSAPRSVRWLTVGSAVIALSFVGVKAVTALFSKNENMERKKVAFIGLGAMGTHMAVNLSRHFTVQCWHYNPEKLSKIISKIGNNNLTSAQSMDALLMDCDFIVTCVPTSKQVSQIAKNVIQSLECAKIKTKIIWFDCTSGEPNVTRELGQLLSTHNIELMDCPVSGGPTKAENGTLTCMVGGNPSVFTSICESKNANENPIKCIGANIAYVGKLGNAHALKSVNNVMNVTHLLIAAEMLSYCDAFGIDINLALNVLNQSSGQSLMTRIRFPTHIIDGNYNYGFDLGLMRKDVNIAMQLINHSSVKHSQSIIRPIAQLLTEAVSKYGYNADYTECTKLFINPHQ